MCPPCKVAINQGFQNTADLADSLRELIVAEIGDPDAQNEMLLRLADAEMAAKDAVGAVAVDFARCVTPDKRWHALMARL